MVGLGGMAALRLLACCGRPGGNRRRCHGTCGGHIETLDNAAVPGSSACPAGRGFTILTEGRHALSGKVDAARGKVEFFWETVANWTQKLTRQVVRSESDSQVPGHRACS